MIELKPGGIAAIGVISMLFTIIVLLISNRDDGCNIIGVSSLPSCSTSIDLSPRNLNDYSQDDYQTVDKFHEIPEASSIYLFIAGGAALAVNKYIKRGNNGKDRV